MASCAKIRRVDRELDSPDGIPHFTKKRIGEIAKAVDTLCFDLVPYLVTVTVRPVRILNSNAADYCGVSFSEAYCSVMPCSDKFYLLGDIFRRGVQIITDFLEERKLPDNTQERYVLSKFMHFIETGNGEVWHGNVAIIINDEVGVEPLEETIGESTVEMKSKFTHLSRNPQIIAETIVFSFLQKKRHPEKDFFLNPCIGVGNSELVILFYDSEHDVLLETSPVALLDSSLAGSSSQNISLLAIMVSWLVLNHKYLCSGLTEELKSSKADFFENAKHKVKVYQKHLKFQNVDASITSGEVTENSAATSSDFIFQMHQRLSKVIFDMSGSGSDS